MGKIQNNYNEITTALFMMTDPITNSFVHEKKHITKQLHFDITIPLNY